MFVARDKNGNLFIFKVKPYRDKYEHYDYWNSEDTNVLSIDSSMFPQLTWEDEPLEVTMKQEDSTLALSDNNAQQINHVWAMYSTLQQETTKLREENAYWRAKFEDLKKIILNQ